MDLSVIGRTGRERTIEDEGHQADRPARMPPAARLLLSAFLVMALPQAGPLAKDAEVPIPRISPLKQPASADSVGGNVSGVTTNGVRLPPEDIPFPGSTADRPFDGSVPPGAPGDAPLDLANPAGPASGVPPAAAVNPDAMLGQYTLDAKLTETGPLITEGMSWRVFRPGQGPDGKIQLVGESKGGNVTLKLKPGNYFVHASFGRAGVVKQITVGPQPGGETIVLNAGGMRLTALAAKDQPVPAEDISFDIYAPDVGGVSERSLVVSGALTSQVIGLAAGIYHVVCRYGDANAIVRADIKVEPGKLTDATVYQKAARLTLKLVGEHGGEALANTAWSVLTPSGDSVADSVGAFPSVVLAAGDYVAIARHDGKTYERNFTVEPGLNRDVEVIATP